MDPAGKVVFSQKFANDQAAIEHLVVRAGQAATEVRWAIDLTSNAAALLVAVLIAAGQQVVYVPGRVVNRMGGVFRGEAKSDAKDARVIAETARMRTDLSPVTATDELVVELTRLTAHCEDLMADWVRGVNRLRDMLTGIFPAQPDAHRTATEVPRNSGRPPVECNCLIRSARPRRCSTTRTWCRRRAWFRSSLWLTAPDSGSSPIIT